MDIDIRELEAFASVVEKGSFSKAAEDLYLTQPTVSAHVASLERKLDIKLLIRASRTVYPSDAGKLLYGYAKDILKLRAEAVAAVYAFSREMKGTIHIAASAIPGQYYLPQLFQDFRQKYPDITFDLQVLPSKDVAELVSTRNVDLGFTGSVVSLPTCLYQTLAEDRFVVITPDTPEYQLYLSTGFPIRQLAREVFVSREIGSNSRMEMEHFLHSLGIHDRDIHTSVEVHSTPSILDMVSQGAGIAVVPSVICEHLLQQKKLLLFHFDAVKLRQKIYLAHHKNNVLSPIAQTFARYAVRYYAAEGRKPES